MRAGLTTRLGRERRAGEQGEAGRSARAPRRARILRARRGECGRREGWAARGVPLMHHSNSCWRSPSTPLCTALLPWLFLDVRGRPTPLYAALLPQTREGMVKSIEDLYCSGEEGSWRTTRSLSTVPQGFGGGQLGCYVQSVLCSAAVSRAEYGTARSLGRSTAAKRPLCLMLGVCCRRRQPRGPGLERGAQERGQGGAGGAGAAPGGRDRGERGQARASAAPSARTPGLIDRS